ELYETSGYKSVDYYNSSKSIKNAVDFIISPEVIKVGDVAKLKELHHEIISKDWFMTLIDLEEYIDAKDKIFAMYENQGNWAKMALVNIANAGFFSSDRTIAEYNRDIWKCNA
ncbi:MAG: glycogen/starch/alpha-glucan phosphorylase, partial [Burkholderiales bacterium]|nr:glycogen/starch/alpha-glucan phosphorylase [Burkholderiales bacterium]